jgi:beta-glucanase (GH16 family)
MIQTFTEYLKFYFIILFVIISFNKSEAQEYQLVWSDEFDGTSLSLSKWEYQLGNGQNGWGNNERQYYRAENAVVNDGYLTITAKKEKYNNFDYTSARIRTLNKGDWKYGKIEMSARLPIGKGIWPAFWMMPTDNVYGGWAASGEIDIMEYLGHDSTKVYGTIHYGGSWPNNVNSGSFYTLPDSGFNNNFHTFTIIWEEGRMDWYVDGNHFLTKTSWYTSGHDFPAPFDQEFHVILNLAVGGNWPGYPDTTTKFPQEYIIDYVRVYQKDPTSIEEQEDYQPEGFLLNQNYPNPFNSQTVINYEISRASHIKLSLHDLLGRTVDILVNQEQGPGVYSVAFDAEGLSSGSYIYSLNTDNQKISRKLLLLK